MKLLVKRGFVEQVETDKGIAYVVTNKYVMGKPFAKAGKSSETNPEDDVVAELAAPIAVSEYEADREANMARNAAFLASLGL